MTFFQICSFCKKRRFRVKCQKLKIEKVGEIVSKKPMCKFCARGVEIATNG
jgi:hypothetical protein